LWYRRERTRAFAEAVGARVELKIEKATCRENPQWDYLRSVGGDHNPSPSDRDWHIPKLAMVAVRVSRDQRLALVGSREYFAAHPKPNSPHELTSHRCTNLRGGSSGPYRWEFEKGSETLVVDVNGPLVLDDADLMIRAATDGLGLTFSFEEYVAPQIASGALVRVLEDWCPPLAGYFLYYPSRGQQRCRRSSRRCACDVQRRNVTDNFAAPQPSPNHRTPHEMELRNVTQRLSWADLRFSLRIRRVEPPVGCENLSLNRNREIANEFAGIGSVAGCSRRFPQLAHPCSMILCTGNGAVPRFFCRGQILLPISCGTLQPPRTMRRFDSDRGGLARIGGALRHDALCGERDSLERSEPPKHSRGSDRVP
jgi:hypothetical protein